MIISRKIISQWLNIDNIEDYNIVNALNNLGFEVNQVKNLAFSNKNLIVGQIIKISKHPKSSNLNICEVTIGSDILNIISNAQNISIGNKVIIAKVGSILDNGFKVFKKLIKDIFSLGIICSLTELGISCLVQNSEELNGIVHLPNNAIVGHINPLQYLNLDDTIFFINLTINRSDCLGIYNIAKELSNYFKIPLKSLEIYEIQNINNKNQVSVLNNKINALATIKISFDNDKQSIITPIWIRRLLQLLNIIPKTFFENIMNLVMLELGQPLIIFSADILKEPSLNISPKSYPEGNLNIKKGDILFHDKYLVFSVLGINNNIEYEIKSNTKEIFVFSINPDFNLMIQQVKRHGVLTNILLERLTKPIVPDYYLIALQRYLFILNKLKVKYKISDFSNDVPYQIEPKIINFNYKIINKILGTKFNIYEIINFLNIIGCQVFIDTKNKEFLKLIIPTHRNDLNNINDFSEEIARLFGYDKLPVIKPKLNLSFNYLSTSLENLINNLRQHLISYGFNQVKTYNLTNFQNLNNFNFFNYKIPLKLESPLTLKKQVMRFSLIDSLLKICQYNYSFKQKKLKIFTDEVIYTGDEVEDNHHLAFLIMDFFWPKFINNKINNNYYFVKGFLDGFLAKVIPNLFDFLIYKDNKNNSMNKYLSTDIFFEKYHIITFGALHPQIEKSMNIKKIFLSEINCSNLLKIINKNNKIIPKFQIWSKFNFLSRDLSIIIDNNIQFFDLKKTIISQNIDFLKKISLIDFYRDEKLKSQYKYSLTLNFEFNSMEKQLDEKKVNLQMQIIEDILKKNFKVIIR